MAERSREVATTSLARNDFCAREENVASFWLQSVNWRRNSFAAAESRHVLARNLSTSSEKRRPESLSSGTASTTRFSGVWLVGSAAAVCSREEAFTGSTT